jgi:ATP-dependent helicase STH1/SNF2
MTSINSQEDSWVYQDANEMQKVFEEVFLRETAGTDMPGAEPLNSANPIHPGNTSPLSAADDDEPAPRLPGHKSLRRASVSDEEYLSGSDDD